MQPIDCAHCGVTVLAEKFSPEHTAVQWIEEVPGRCPYIGRSDSAPATPGTRKKTCPELYATINGAAREGRLAFSRRTEPVPGEIA